MTTRDDILYFELMCLFKEALEKMLAYINSNGQPPVLNESFIVPSYQNHKLTRNRMGNIEGCQLVNAFDQSTGQPVWIFRPGYITIGEQIMFMSYLQDNKFEFKNFNEGYQMLYSYYKDAISIYSSSDFNESYSKYGVGLE